MFTAASLRHDPAVVKAVPGVPAACRALVAPAERSHGTYVRIPEPHQATNSLVTNADKRKAKSRIERSNQE